MPRSRGSRKRPWADPHRDLDLERLGTVPRTETGPDGADYQVQYVGAARKQYVCPGCLRPISVGSPHVVAWPEEAPFGARQGVDARRHWHQECWRRRLRPS